jgi:hypothetical protein
MAFQKLGYMYVMNPNINKVRAQILHPGQMLINTPFIIADEKGIPEDVPPNVYYARLDNIICVVVILNLQLLKSEYKHRKAIVLPHPKDSQCIIYSLLSEHIGELINVRLINTVSPLPISPVKLDEKINDLYDNNYE